VPTGIVIGSDLVETHFDVHSRTDPLQGVDGAPIQGGIELSGRDVGHEESQSGDHFARESGNAHPKPRTAWW
jgi:hypothetical protein